MKKLYYILAGIIVISFVYFTLGSAKEEAKMCTPNELFTAKCTQCHDAQKAMKIHESKTYWIDVIRKMQVKKGVNISDKDAEEVAKLLGDPNRAIYENKCSKCHSLDKVDKTHMTDETCKVTVEKMSKKEGSNISEQEKKTIEKHLLYRNKPTYPTAPQR